MPILFARQKLSRFARSVGMSVMALDTCFLSRDALLDAVADHVLAIFVAPSERQRWQDHALDWLWAFQRHFDNHPIALKLLAGMAISRELGSAHGCQSPAGWMPRDCAD